MKTKLKLVNKSCETQRWGFKVWNDWKKRENQHDSTSLFPSFSSFFLKTPSFIPCSLHSSLLSPHLTFLLPASSHHLYSLYHFSFFPLSLFLLYSLILSPLHRLPSFSPPPSILTSHHHLYISSVPPLIYLSSIVHLFTPPFSPLFPSFFPSLHPFFSRRLPFTSFLSLSSTLMPSVLPLCSLFPFSFHFSLILPLLLVFTSSLYPLLSLSFHMSFLSFAASYLPSLSSLPLLFCFSVVPAARHMDS